MQFTLPQLSIISLQPVTCQKMLVGVAGAFTKHPSPFMTSSGMPSSSWSQPSPLRYTQTLLAGYNFSQECMRAALFLGSFPGCATVSHPPTRPLLAPLRAGDRGRGPQGHPGWDWPCHPSLTSGHVRCQACCCRSPPSLPETHPFRDDLCFLL